MKKIADASVEIGISKQALYSKVKMSPYNRHTRKIKGTLHISDDGIDLIRKNMSQVIDLNCKTNNQLIDMLSKQVESKDSEISFLREQVNKLNQTLESTEETKNKQVNQVYKLLEQQQILTLNYQTKIKDLEEPTQDNISDKLNSDGRKLTWIERIIGITR